MLATLWENLGKAWHVRYPTAVLCHRYKCKYYPVPKVATSSIRRMFAAMDGRSTDGNPHHDIELDSVWAGDSGRYDDYVAFTVVRNPWDRLVSCFKEKVAGSYSDQSVSRDEIHDGFSRYNRILGREFFHRDMPFAEFVRVIGWIPDTLADEHFRSQHRMFSTPGGHLLVDRSRILKFEAFNDGLKALLNELGAVGFEIGHELKTRRSDYRSFYTDETRARVERLYRRDIELFGYTF